MADFAMFQSLSPKTHEGFRAKYGTLTDELFDQILELLDPNPFSVEDMRCLLAELDSSTTGQRGYPAGGQPVRVKLALQLWAMNIPELSKETKEALCKRLETGKRFTGAMYDFKADKQVERLRLRMFVRGLYAELKKKPDNEIGSGGLYDHPILGKVAVPTRDPKELPSRHKYRIVNAVMADKMGYPNRDPGTLANIASG